MAVAYLSTRGGDLLSASPRAVWRVTVRRTARLALRNAGFYPFNQWTFADAVARGVDEGLGPIAYHVGRPAVDRDDSRAVLDTMASVNAGGADVRALVQRVNDASPYWDVVSVERIGSTPAQSQGGAGALSSTRDAALDAARAAAADDALFSRIASALGVVGSGARKALLFLLVALVVAAIAAAVLNRTVRGAE